MPPENPASNTPEPVITLEHPRECEGCNESFESDDMRYIHGRHQSAWWCETCNGDRHGTCQHCGRYEDQDDMHHTPNGVYCPECYNIRYADCNNCGEEVRRSDAYTDPSGDIVCGSCFEEACTSCERCGRTILTDNAQYENDGENGPYCGECIESYEKLNSTTFDDITSRRRVGIEIEFCSVSSPNLITWGRLKGDGSVVPQENENGEGREFASHIVNGDQIFTMLKDVHERIKLVDGFVNKSCGLHVHLDVEGNSTLQRQNIALWYRALERVFVAFVSPSRRGNGYAREVGYEDYHRWERDRYRAMNLSSICKHGTIELRLHQGTLNPMKIVNWVKLWLTFFDTFQHINTDVDRLAQVENMSDREKLIFLFQQIKMPLSMRKYWVQRVKEFQTRAWHLDLTRKTRAA